MASKQFETLADRSSRSCFAWLFWHPEFARYISVLIPLDRTAAAAHLPRDLICSQALTCQGMYTNACAGSRTQTPRMQTPRKSVPKFISKAGSASSNLSFISAAASDEDDNGSGERGDTSIPSQERRRWREYKESGVQRERQRTVSASGRDSSEIKSPRETNEVSRDKGALGGRGGEMHDHTSFTRGNQGAQVFTLNLGSIRAQREAEERGGGGDARRVEYSHSARASHGLMSDRPHVIYAYMYIYTYKNAHMTHTMYAF